jgi:hypothetical protein
MNSDAAKRVNDSLRQALSSDLIGQYVVKIEAEIGTNLNPSAISQVVGGSTN